MNDVTPEQIPYHSEFSHLLANPLDREPAELRRALPSIARAGISIIFPSRKIDNYLALLSAELAIKQSFLSQRQPVCCLRLRGLPFRQCSQEQLTELIFRLCFRYKILDPQEGERQISLTLEHCTSDHLALLKGLGFNHVRLVVDASIAGPDRSLDPVAKAMAIIHGFSGFSVAAGIHYGKDTSPEYLKRLTGFMVDGKIDELELFWDNQGPMLPKEQIVCLKIFEIIGEALVAADYRLIGDRCFKSLRHPHLQLLAAGKLGYGPWGFYNRNISEWLGLGLGADGMIAGYLYHNATHLADYQRSIAAAQSPIVGWSRQPVIDDRAFEVIRQLYCDHGVDRSLFSDRLAVLGNLVDKGWLTDGGTHCALTRQGIINLPAICGLYSHLPS